MDLYQRLQFPHTLPENIEAREEQNGNIVMFQHFPLAQSWKLFLFDHQGPARAATYRYRLRGCFPAEQGAFAWTTRFTLGRERTNTMYQIISARAYQIQCPGDGARRQGAPLHRAAHRYN